MFIEIWSLDQNNNHVKIGSTITKTNADFDAFGGVTIDVPRDGLFYLDIRVEVDCDECCGKNNNLNPDKCEMDLKGRPFWIFKSNPIQSTTLMQSISLTFERCACYC
jgi:hypothetical protein